MWYIHFFNAPTRDSLIASGEVFESDKVMTNKPEDGYTFLFTSKNGNMSGFWVKYTDDSEQRLALGIVDDSVSMKDLAKYLFDYHYTICVDESVYEDAAKFPEEMTQEEIDLMWDFLFLSQMLARQIVRKDSAWVTNILGKSIDYLAVIDKYNLYFTDLNFFRPSDKAIEELKKHE